MARGRALWPTGALLILVGMARAVTLAARGHLKPLLRATLEHREWNPVRLARLERAMSILETGSRPFVALDPDLRKVLVRVAAVAQGEDGTDHTPDLWLAGRGWRHWEQMGAGAIYHRGSTELRVYRRPLSATCTLYRCEGHP